MGRPILTLPGDAARISQHKRMAMGHDPKHPSDSIEADKLAKGKSTAHLGEKSGATHPDSWAGGTAKGPGL